MASVDEVLKKQADRHIHDYLQWLFGESVSVLEKLGTELAQGKRADLVYRLQNASGTPFIFHLELQQDRSKDPMNLRMAGYDIRLREVHRLPVCGVVIYLKESADEGFNGWFIGKCPFTEDEDALRFRYREVKLWEEDGMELLRTQPVGIYPLLVLTQLPEPTEESLRQMVDEIKQIPDRLLVQDTLFAFKLLGSIIGLEGILDRLIRRSDIMESTFLQEIYLEGRQEGIQQSIQQVRSATIEIMTNRFDLNYKAGKALDEKMEDIEDLSLLHRLLVEAAMIQSPEEFIAQLQE